MSYLEKLYVIKSKINAVRLLFVALLILVFLAICQGQNLVGLLLMLANVIVLCILTYMHSGRIKHEHTYTGGE